jgi:sulfate permease, SulP family
MVVAFALIPEAIGFSIIVGVDPQIGLYASFCITTVIALAGGRTAIIYTARGSCALVITTLVAEHELHYLLAAILLAGVLQILARLLRLHALLRFISKSVMIGFVNALAILMFMVQLREFNDAGWVMYAFVAAGLMIIDGLPSITNTRI